MLTFYPTNIVLTRVRLAAVDKGDESRRDKSAPYEVIDPSLTVRLPLFKQWSVPLLKIRTGTVMVMIWSMRGGAEEGARAEKNGCNGRFNDG